MKQLIVLALVALGACSTAPTAEDPQVPPVQASESVQVMVLGTYHFAGSTSDLINLETENVLSPQRQSELADLSEALAVFAPTMIVTERETEAPDYIDPVYSEFDDEMLASSPNERVQIAYRLARLVGLGQVHGIDEHPTTSEPDYFPFGSIIDHANQVGRSDEVQAVLGDARAFAEGEMERLQSLSIARALYEVNSGPMSAPDFYYKLLEFDSGEDQPGAELNAYWFMRNAKIFAKLQDVAQAGDRVIIVYGAGHKFWLEHLVTQTPGYELVAPEPYLLSAE